MMLRKTARYYLLLTTVFILCNHPLSAVQRFHLTAKLSHMKSQLSWLQANGFDITAVDHQTQEVDLLVQPNEFDHLQKSQFPIIAAHEISQRQPDPQYFKPETLASALKAVAKRYPEITHLVTVGKSLENRPILALKISDNPGKREADEPTILFNAMHHSREVMTTEVAMDIVQTLTTGYGHNSKITNWVNHNEIWILPMLNVDGNHRVWNKDNMWRKNTRENYGVDINRNYPLTWNQCNGSSGSKWSQTYRGPAAASEPETRALMQLVNAIQPVFNISYHSYSELVLYPLGCEGKRTATANVVEPIGRQLAKKLIKDRGTQSYTPGTPWDILYAVDGDDISWMYLQHQVIPYVIEVNGRSQGFQPDYKEWRNVTVEKMRPGWQFLIERLGGGGVRGEAQDEQGRPILTAKVLIKAGGAIIQTYPVKADGRFHIILNEGSYSVEVVAPGFSSFKTTLKVKDSRIPLFPKLRRKTTGQQVIVQGFSMSN